MAESTTGSILRRTKRPTPVKRVSFREPSLEDFISMESEEDLTVDEPSDMESRVQVLKEHDTGINCYFLKQESRISVLGIPLSDLVFAVISALLVTGSNLLLVSVCICLMVANDWLYGYVLGFILADRVAVALYRYWSDLETSRRWQQVCVDVLLTSVFLDTTITAVSMLVHSDPRTPVPVSLVEGTKQWTAVSFLSAPGRLVTRFKTLCLISAATHSWQVLGLIAATTRGLKNQEQLLLTSLACSTALICWGVTISLPTVPVPQLFSTGYWVVLRTLLKLGWLLCIAGSRLLACHWFASAMGGAKLLWCGVAHSALTLSYSLVSTRLHLRHPLLPKLAVTCSVYLLVFVHPMRGHLDHAYGIAHIFYLCQNVLMVYGTREVDAGDVTWLLIGVGVFSLGVVFLLCLLVLNMTVPHPRVHVVHS